MDYVWVFAIVAVAVGLVCSGTRDPLQEEINRWYAAHRRFLVEMNADRAAQAV